MYMEEMRTCWRNSVLHVCIHELSMHVCSYMRTRLCIRVVHVCVNVWRKASVFACMSMHVGVPVCMCVYVCVFVCVCVCVCVYMSII